MEAVVGLARHSVGLKPDLQLSQSRRDRQPRGAQAGQQAADECRAQRVDEACTSSCGVTVNANVIWLKVAKFIVEARMPLNAKYEISMPIDAADDAEQQRLRRAPRSRPAMEPKPSARSVAISRVRADTAEYIVLSAAKIAPSPISTAMATPIVRTSVSSDLRLLLVVLPSR